MASLYSFTAERWTYVVESHDYMAETAAILESAASFLKLGAKKLWFDYDEEADVLYVSLRRPQQASDSRTEGDLIYHYRDKELVGVTILHASEIRSQHQEKWV